MKNVKFMVEAGAMIALAFVLSKIDLFTMPQGGSVSPGAILPILFLAYRWGVGRGILAGVLLGILKMMLGGYVIGPIQGILDYPLAYGVLGIAGLAHPFLYKDEKNESKEIKHSTSKENNSFSTANEDTSRKPLAIAVCLAFLGALLKYVCHVLSGLLFFSDTISLETLIGSLSYNSFVGADFLISMVLLLILWKPLHTILQKVNP